jgi:nitrogen fixation NifU-like protein
VINLSDQNLKLLDHFRNPRNVGVIDDADGHSRGKNPITGYITDFYIKVENEQIKDAKYKAQGCVATIATVSVLSEIIKGKSLDEIVNGGNPLERLMGLINDEIGEIPEKNWHCLPTSILTLFTTILDYYKKKNDKKKIIQIEKILKDINNYFTTKL